MNYINEWILKIKSKRYKRLGREFIWISVGQGVAALGGLIGVRVITEFLDPEAYGQLALGMTLQTLIFLVVLGPLSNGATRFYAPAVETGKLRSYLTAVRSMVLSSTTGIIFLAFLSGFVMIYLGLFQWMGLGIAALLFAILFGYNSILNGIQNAARQQGHGLL